MIGYHDMFANISAATFGVLSFLWRFITVYRYLRNFQVMCIYCRTPSYRHNRQVSYQMQSLRFQRAKYGSSKAANWSIAFCVI